jgi:hypothetical protein
MPTTSQRLDNAQIALNRAMTITTNLWTNKDLDILFSKPEHTETERQLRENLVSARIAIINASNEIQILKLIHED